MSRDLNDVFAGNDQINKDLFTYTEYLTTLIAIVPTSNMKDWENGYERLDDCILPKSNFDVSKVETIISMTNLKILY